MFERFRVILALALAVLASAFLYVDPDAGFLYTDAAFIGLKSNRRKKQGATSKKRGVTSLKRRSSRQGVTS